MTDHERAKKVFSEWVRLGIPPFEDTHAMRPEEKEAIIGDIANAIKAAVAEEREACAYLVQDFKTDSPPGTICHWGEGLARIIRKRGKA